MTLDELAKLAGVLGFFISLATFLLTRWERRVPLDFGLEPGEPADAGFGSDEPLETVKLSVANLGSRPVILNVATLEVWCNGNVLHVWRQDYLGDQQQEVLLKPTERYAIGIPLNTFLQELKITSPEKYDERTFYALSPVLVRLRTSDGRKHESEKLRYWEATNEFHRA